MLVYLDDILIYSKTVDEHRKLLHEVFSLLEEHQLYVKESKCSLFLESIEFLGHVIDSNGVLVEPGKTDAIKSWPVPQTVTEVQQLLGLANYYHKFVYKYSEIAHPLTFLTQKSVRFRWSHK